MDSLHIHLISIFTAIDGRVVMLQPDNLKDEPDMSITSQELMIGKKDEEEEESFGLLTLIMVELRPVVEVRGMQRKLCFLAIFQSHALYHQSNY